MIQIRPYKQEDFGEISAWWILGGEPLPDRDEIPEKATYILELDSVPALAVSLYFIEGVKSHAYIESLVGNPKLKGPARYEATKILLEHLIGVARSRGVKNLICLAYRPELKKRYESLGFTQTLDNVATFRLPV